MCKKKFQGQGWMLFPDNEEVNCSKGDCKLLKKHDYLMEQIDSVLEMVLLRQLLQVKSLSQIEQFFLAIAPYVKAKRQDKVTKVSEQN